MSEPAKKILERQIALEGIPQPVQEHKFHPERKWRFDYCWPDFKIALELEGGAFSKGRHTNGKGFTEDIVKYNEAQRLGWSVFRATSEQVKIGYAIGLLILIFHTGEL